MVEAGKQRVGLDFTSGASRTAVRYVARRGSLPEHREHIIINNTKCTSVNIPLFPTHPRTRNLGVDIARGMYVV